jgi:hypothetical protein
MPTGQPDSREPQPWNSVMEPEKVEPVAERIIREAIEAGEFDDLTGTGKPIPGRGSVDDEMWWVRLWLERNRGTGHQESSNSE